MSEKVEPEELKEAARGAYRQLQDELERKTAEAEELKVRMCVVEATQGLLEEIDRLKTEAETMLNEIDGLNQLIQEKDMQLKELRQLTAGVAKKSSADDVSKAIRIYLNMSKRKTQSKREVAKSILLELITAAKLELSEGIMESLNHFDDEELTDQPQPTGTANENVAELLTAEAQVLWQRLRDAGLIVAWPKGCRPTRRPTSPTAWPRSCGSRRSGSCFSSSGASPTWLSWLVLGSRRASCRPVAAISTS